MWETASRFRRRQEEREEDALKNSPQEYARRKNFRLFFLLIHNFVEDSVSSCGSRSAKWKVRRGGRGKKRRRGGGGFGNTADKVSDVLCSKKGKKRVDFSLYCCTTSAAAAAAAASLEIPRLCVRRGRRGRRREIK